MGLDTEETTGDVCVEASEVDGGTSVISLDEVEDDEEVTGGSEPPKDNSESVDKSNSCTNVARRSRVSQ